MIKTCPGGEKMENKNKMYKILTIGLVVTILLLTLDLNISEAANTGIKEADVKDIYNDIKMWYGIGSIFCAVMALGAFIYNIIRLGASSTNTKVRQDAIRGMMISGTVGALVPVSYLFYGIIVNFMTLT